MIPPPFKMMAAGSFETSAPIRVILTIIKQDMNLQTEGFVTSHISPDIPAVGALNIKFISSLVSCLVGYLVG